MFDDSHEHENDDARDERVTDPLVRAREKFDQFRMHAEFAAVFEGPRKFEAQLLPQLDGDLARDIQRTMARLEKARMADSPLLPPGSDAARDAAAVLSMPKTRNLSTNDYHIHRRPGEVMIVRWLAGDEVEQLYTRFQAHFDAALKQFREEERQQHAWRQDENTLKYLDALDAIDVRMADRYLRDPIRQHNLFVLSTQAADELDILHLSDYVMGVTAADLVGRASAPPEDAPTEQDRAWFFKLFALRGVVEGQERMCFFTFLQKTDEAW